MMVSGTSTHPLGRNWFFQPGLGPGFFRTRGSSKVFGFCLLRVLLSLEVLEEERMVRTSGQNLISTVDQNQESRTQVQFLKHVFMNREKFCRADSASVPLVLDWVKHLLIGPGPVLLELLLRDCPETTEPHQSDRSKEFGLVDLDGTKETHLSDRSLSAVRSWSGPGAGDVASSGKPGRTNRTGLSSQ